MHAVRLLILNTFLSLLFSCNNHDKNNIPKKSSVKEDNYAMGNLIVADKNEFSTDSIYKQPRIKYTNVVGAVIFPTLSQSVNSFKEECNSITKDVQVFTINPKTDTIIICKEGTVLKIKPAAFLMANETPITENIILQVKEFYKIADMILANLSTQSKDKIIETGGMLYINAISNGQECILNDKLPIEISFPYAEKKDSMLLFTGNWEKNKIDWKESAMQVPLKKDSFEIAFLTDFENYIRRNINYDNIYDSVTNERALIELEITKTGKAKLLSITRTENQSVLDAINKFVAKMPLWQPAKNNGEPIKCAVRIPVLFINGEEETNDSLYKENFEKVIYDSTLSNQKIADIRRYVFSTSKLGWLNCDRFYNDGRTKNNIDVNCGEYDNIEVKMVFHSFRSILEGEAFGAVCKFYNIPENEKVTVVAIKKMKSKTYISLEERNTNNVFFGDLHFEEVSMDKLKEKLEILNELK
ncbi:MAG: hypothetical protein WDM90_22540 [Ferruginibacter sp.]